MCVLASRHPYDTRNMDAVTTALLELIGAQGFTVSFEYDDFRRPIASASAHETGETFVVRHDTLYAATCELAELVGIELDDG